MRKFLEKLRGKKEKNNSSYNRISTRHSDNKRNDGEGTQPLLAESSVVDNHRRNEPLKKRWTALGLFGALACSQSCIWNTWGPIGASAMFAFPTWHKSSLAFLSNWGCITYLTCCFSCCWFLKSVDLLVALKVAAILSTIATFIRSISSREMIITTAAHIAAMLNGLAGVIVGPTTALVSATWFPYGERTTATGISSACGQLGIALSYLLGPSLVGHSTLHHIIISSKNVDDDFYINSDGSIVNITPRSKEIFRNISKNLLTSDQMFLRVQIMSLMRIEFFIQFLVLIGILWFFPQQIEISSSSSRVSTDSFSKSLIKLIRHKSMWLLSLAAAFSQGMTGPWLAMITMAFGSTITQDEADNLAFWTVISSSILSLCATRIMDTFQGHLKIAIYTLLFSSTMMFLWIILLDTRAITFHKNELYAAVIFGIATSWSTSPLFLELASEIAFPISEAIVGGYLIFLSNIIGSIFYLSFIIPGIGGTWSTSLVFSNLIIATILVICVKDEYSRTKFESGINLT